MYHQINEGIQAHYAMNPAGQVCITFADPEYVQSDMILFNPIDFSLHAVLHETLHLIGHVDVDMRKKFTGQSEVVLSAPHYFSGTINSRTPLVVSH